MNIMKGLLKLLPSSSLQLMMSQRVSPVSLSTMQKLMMMMMDESTGFNSAIFGRKLRKSLTIIHQNGDSQRNLYQSQFKSTHKSLRRNSSPRLIRPSSDKKPANAATPLFLNLRKFSNDESKMNQLHQAKNIWRKANAICFDVDSTVIEEEAIDELAKYLGKGDEVQQLTMEAMKGGMDFREALAIRLDLIRPSSMQLRNFIHGQKHRLTPYVKELVYELHKREKEVYLISGGFKSIIEPIARSLDIPTSNVYANKLKFFYDGEYAGFDEHQLTSRSGGKGAAVRDLKEKHGYETVVMVGDGITDWEAAPPADLFIGFGGNAYRNEVKNKAKWYVTDFRDLINELRD